MNAVIDTKQEAIVKLYMSSKTAKALLLFAAKSDTRKQLNGFCIDVLSDESARIIATDGHRLLCINEYEIQSLAYGKTNQNFIAPREALEFIAKNARYIDASIHITERQIVISHSGMVVHFDLIDMQYPDYSLVIPKGGQWIESPARISPSYLLDAHKALVLLDASNNKFCAGRPFAVFDDYQIQGKFRRDNIGQIYGMPAWDRTSDIVRYRSTVDCLDTQPVIYCADQETAENDERRYTIVIMPCCR